MGVPSYVIEDFLNPLPCYSPLCWLYYLGRPVLAKKGMSYSLRLPYVGKFLSTCHAIVLANQAIISAVLCEVIIHVCQSDVSILL